MQGRIAEPSESVNIASIRHITNTTTNTVKIPKIRKYAKGDILLNFLSI